jgi:hypothetical protein
MIETLLDACQLVLREQGEPQSSYWLASLLVETKLWRASEAKVRAALNKDIDRLGERSRFVCRGDDAFALRSWKQASMQAAVQRHQPAQGRGGCWG